MNDINTIVARPRPGVKRIKISDPVADLAAEIERILIDTSRNKDVRLRLALMIARDAQELRRRSLEEREHFTNDKYPSEQADKFVLRLPEGMRQQIAEAAKKNGRSMNSEIIFRLKESFAICEISVPRA